ncbi:MAG TPA: hypothetical protein DIS66_04960, partial [Candidatus Omnitrophica bacterium]|nr:hypothetical protein [Candidatus Omnitrophota bacterium]
MFLRFLISALFAFTTFITPVFSEPSVAEQRQQVIQKARQDLDTIRTQLTQRMNEQVKLGDKEGARNTQVRILAATDLANMLDAAPQTGGDIFKVRLIESYNGILNVTDFSESSFREIMNSYNRIGPDQLYDATEIVNERVDTKSDKKDLMALRALQDRAIYFAAQSTYEDMHSGFQRGMAGVALAINDTFADLNPATSLLEAAIGTKVSGEDIGKDMTAGERAGSLFKFVIEMVVDVGTEKLMKDTMKGLKTRVGDEPGAGDSKAPAKGAADKGSAPDSAVKSAEAGRVNPNERVIGQVNLDDVSNIDDMTPLTGLDNFNIDLRTGQVTTSPTGRIGAADQTQIEAGLKPQGPLGGDQKIDLQGTSATAVIKPPMGNGEQVIGYVDLENVNDVFDAVGFTHLDNFNIDLRTGQVTTSGAPGGRIDAAGQAQITEGFKPQGPLGGDQKIDLDFQHRTTEIDIQGQTTVRQEAVWGGSFNSGFNDPKPVSGTIGPRDELKPLWDLFDLPHEESKQLPAPKQIHPIIVYIEDPNGGPRVGILIDVFNEGLSPFNPPPADPFGD